MFNLFKKDEKEYNYFRTFKGIALQIVEATDLIAKNLKKDPFNFLEEAVDEIKENKESVNYQKKELLNYLYEDFLPPIERKDLIGLTHALETVLKNTIDLFIHLDMYQIKTIQPQMNQLMELIKLATNKLPQMMQDLEDFKHPQKIREVLEEMNEINIKGAQLYQQAVKSLYLGEMNPVDTIKYTKVYEHFNEVLGSIEKLMNGVEAVIIENT